MTLLGSLKKKIRKPQGSLLRIISAFVILAVLLPPIFLTALLGEAGVYIGLVFYIAIAFWGMFEIFNNFCQKYSVIFLSSLVLIVFFLNFDYLTEIIRNFSKYNSEGFLFGDALGEKIERGIDGWALLITILASFIPTIWDRKIRATRNLYVTQFLISSIVVIIATFSKIMWIINIGDSNFGFLVFLIAVPIVCDTFSYVGGRYLSKYLFKGVQLAPSISPQKTLTGFLVGFLATALFVGLTGYYLNFFDTLEQNEIFITVIFALFLPLLSTGGDLYFSACKRYLNIKDFSKLIPGHGGIFDRLDAMSFVFLFVGLVFVFS